MWKGGPLEFCWKARQGRGAPSFSPGKLYISYLSVTLLVSTDKGPLPLFPFLSYKSRVFFFPRFCSTPFPWTLPPRRSLEDATLGMSTEWTNKKLSKSFPIFLRSKQLVLTFRLLDICFRLQEPERKEHCVLQHISSSRNVDQSK